MIVALVGSLEGWRVRCCPCWLRWKVCCWTYLHYIPWCGVVGWATGARVLGQRSQWLKMDTEWPGWEYPYSDCFSGALFAGINSVSATKGRSIGSSWRSLGDYLWQGVAYCLDWWRCSIVRQDCPSCYRPKRLIWIRMLPTPSAKMIMWLCWEVSGPNSVHKRLVSLASSCHFRRSWNHVHRRQLGDVCLYFAGSRLDLTRMALRSMGHVQEGCTAWSRFGR